MFTWICPQCGREVPPSSPECPTCAERRLQASQPAQQPPPAPPQQYPPQAPPPQYAPPQQAQPQYAPPAPPPQATYTPPPPPPQQPYQQQAYYPPAGQPQPVYTIGEQNKKGMPTWLAGLLTIAVLGGGLFALYEFVGKKNGTSTADAKSGATSSTAAGGAHPYAKYIEVTGLRLLEGADKKPQVRFAVVNHSPAELAGLELRVTLATTNAAPGTPPIAVVTSKVGSVPAHGIKDIESPLQTKLRVYELPDWQFVKAAVEITGPK